MIGVSGLLTIMRRVLQTVALALGSFGIMALWDSFYRPDCAVDALLMLGTATAITLGLAKRDAAAPARRVIGLPSTAVVA
jgi:multisubunit Na+/H+ antiporter MnhB subunit